MHLTVAQKFFCSELVAEAYTQAGLMKKKGRRSSCEYWPKSFGEGGQIEAALCAGVRLEEATIIDLRELEVAKAKRAYTASEGWK